MNYKEIFEKVWRTDLSQPGFCVIDMGEVDSRQLRQEMLNIKEEFSKFVPFYFEWLMSFDQQITTTFHRDGGPPENILILGYEPSQVQSNLYIGDWLDFAVGKEMPEDKIAKVPTFQEGHSYIVILNNSHRLGIWHKGEILNPDATKLRIINSMQLGIRSGGQVSAEQIESWLNQ